jgi:hypothetical protein
VALFIVRHEHEPDRCPATDPYQGAALLNQLSRQHVRRHGVEIKGEAVVQGEHTLYLIMESTDQRYVQTLLQPSPRPAAVDHTKSAGHEAATTS